ncbi:putative chitinase [Microsporum ferrugineum]
MRVGTYRDLAEDIPLGYYTHINFAFALDPNIFRIAPMDPKTGSLYPQVTALKDRQPDLEVWIAVGGWAMNGPGPTRTTFSELAVSEFRQDSFQA